MVQLMHKFVPWSRIGIFKIDTPDPPHWNLNSCIGAFCSIWVHFGLFCYCVKLGAKQAELEQLMQKFAPRIRIGFFAANPPDPPHCTLNSCFGAFHSVWVHFGLFRYSMKVDAMRAGMVELMHKFVPWSRVRSFQNERTRSTQLNPKLMFCCVS